MEKHQFGFEWSHELEEGILENLKKISCMEIIPENFFGGRFQNFLDCVREAKTPVAVHGVLMSIGSAEALNEAHLNDVLQIASQVNMVNLSEHLALTAVSGVDLDALTPLSWNRETADIVSRKVEYIQSRIEVPFLLENVSNRFVVPDSEMSETEYINYILDKTGCGLLLDVTNVFTNSVNFKFDPYAWVDEINLDSVQLIHLAGGDYDPDGFLMDSHDNTVAKESWELYRYVVEKAPPLMTIIERTGNFPRFDTLMKELNTAEKIVKKARGQNERNRLSKGDGTLHPISERVL